MANANAKAIKQRVDTLLKKAKIASAKEVKDAVKTGKAPVKAPKVSARTKAAAAPTALGQDAASAPPPPPSPPPPPPTGACTISIPGLGPVSCLTGITEARCKGIAQSVGGTASWVVNGVCPS